ncbi:MAG TPA: hypothetical protein VFU15_17425 [Bacteroidia bacterium]|nr:hypothetical protein [Bacteroidia bacterium]
MNEPMVHDEEPAMDMNDDVTEMNDEGDDNSEGNDMRGAFDHF